MLIWETPAIDETVVRRIATHASRTAECLHRIDGRGSVILCEDGEAPSSVAETRASPVLASGETGPTAGPWVFLVRISAPRECRDELCEWYRTEHGPILLECPQWRGFQLLEESSAPNRSHLIVLHRLADRAALDSEERKRSRATPWFARLARNAWFDGPFERILAQRIDAVEGTMP